MQRYKTFFNTEIEIEYKDHLFTIKGDVRWEDVYEDAWSYTNGNHTEKLVGREPVVLEVTAVMSETAPLELLEEVANLASNYGKWDADLCKEFVREEGD